MAESKPRQLEFTMDQVDVAKLKQATSPFEALGDEVISSALQSEAAIFPSTSDFSFEEWCLVYQVVDNDDDGENSPLRIKCLMALIGAATTLEQAVTAWTFTENDEEQWPAIQQMARFCLKEEG